MARDIMLNNEEYLALRNLMGGLVLGEVPTASNRASTTPPKRKRKVSAYQRRFGAELKRLKKAHPRTAVGTLMKRAHRATKRSMK